MLFVTEDVNIKKIYNVEKYVPDNIRVHKYYPETKTYELIFSFPVITALLLTDWKSRTAKIH